MLLGIRLKLLIGPTRPRRAPTLLTESLISAQVTHRDEGQSGFELTFQAGRAGLSEMDDFPLLATPLLKPFSRVILQVTFNGTARVISDGFITSQQLSPSEDPGASTFTVTGEDVSVMMDMEKKHQPHPAQNENAIVKDILSKYTRLLQSDPEVETVRTRDRSKNDESIFQSEMTDLDFLMRLAHDVGHVFYVTPGPEPEHNLAHWGPPVRGGIAQSALSVNMGPSSNVDQIGFTYNAIAPTVVADDVLATDGDVTKLVSVLAANVSREALAAIPAEVFNQGNVRRSKLSSADATGAPAEPRRRGGMTLQEAQMLAQAKVDRSADQAVTATGQLDTLRYGEILNPRAVVEVRGAGGTYNGRYYVKSVTHSISIGQYKQSFVLNREGVGALDRFVRP
jgi:hypothetical protein